jgi:hypothetical protein
MLKLIGLFLITLSFTIQAASLDSISFNDKVNVEGRELVLNGIGIRKATFLKIKVYYGGLYLEQKSKDPEAFLKTSAPKQIVMQFVREVDAKKLREAFLEGMEAANKNHASFKAQMDKFNSYIVNVVKNDQFTISFLNDGVIFSVNGKISEKIPGTDFSHALLSIWLINPRDEGLRSGLLGLN